MQTSNLRTRVVSTALASVLAASGMGLVACGGQQGSSASSAQSAASTATQSTVETSEPAAEATDTASRIQAFSAEAFEAYAGTTDAGKQVFYAANRDSSTCMLVFVDETDNYACYLGSLSVDGNTYTITDSVSGKSIAFGFTQDETGTLTLDLGTPGKATVAPSQTVFDEIGAIDWSGQTA